MRFKEIKKFLKENNIEFWEENNKIFIKACEVGENNFYDYGEEETPLHLNEEFSFLKDDNRIHFIRCNYCCGCAGW